MSAPPFTALAAVYDAIMADVEYEHWADFVLTYARDGGLSPKSALDLACGTGRFTQELLKAGLEVTGLDASAEMLAVARRRFPQVNFIQADLRNVQLGQRFDLLTCVFDSLNNLLEPDDLSKALACCWEHLHPGGLLACDLNTQLGVRELWEGEVLEGLAQTEDGQEVQYHWVHHYDQQRRVGVVQAHCRLLERDGSGTDFVEVHEERGYDPAEVSQLLQMVGFQRFEIVEYPDYAEPQAQTPRIWVFAWKDPA